jgi:hypothetical protein
MTPQLDTHICDTYDPRTVFRGKGFLGEGAGWWSAKSLRDGRINKTVREAVDKVGEESHGGRPPAWLSQKNVG